MPVIGPRYTNAQLRQLWIDAGGNPQAAPTAAAIAQAESGGGANSYNRNTNGTIDRGLWQINSVHGTKSTFDVMANARAAVNISNNGQNWNPWTTFTSGAYKRYLNGAPGGNSGGGIAIPKGSGGTATSGNATNADLVSTVTGIDWLHTVDVFGNWVAYIAMVGMGGILLAVGLVMIVRTTAVGAAVNSVRGAAKSVLPL
jgi:hypothetical protein